MTFLVKGLPFALMSKLLKAIRLATVEKEHYKVYDAHWDETEGNKCRDLDLVLEYNKKSKWYQWIIKDHDTKLTLYSNHYDSKEKAIKNLRLFVEYISNNRSSINEKQ